MGSQQSSCLHGIRFAHFPLFQRKGQDSVFLLEGTLDEQASPQMHVLRDRGAPGLADSPSTQEVDSVPGGADDLSRREFLQQATASSLVVASAVSGLAPLPAAQSAEEERPGAVPVTLQINGKKHELKLEPRVTLLDALREHLGLTGTKKGAIMASAAPAPCWSTAGASTPA